MTETQQLATATPAQAPLLLRSRVLLTLGWTLLTLALVMLTFDVLWMWNRFGRAAWIVAIALGLDAAVGVGLIWAGSRAKRTATL